MGLGVRYVVIKKDGQELVEEIHKVVVHRFQISDADSPDVWAGHKLWEWQESESGKFVMEHAIEKPVWKRHTSYEYMGHEYAIIAELEKKKYSEFLLRFKNGNNKS